MGVGQSNPQETGEFNAHDNVRRCKLITPEGKDIPWCNVLDWRWRSDPPVFDEIEFTYKSGEVNGKTQKDSMTVTFPYGFMSVFDQIKWNNANCDNECNCNFSGVEDVENTDTTEDVDNNNIGDTPSTTDQNEGKNEGCRIS